MTVLGKSPLGRPYLGSISQTAGSGSRAESDLGIENKKIREIKEKPRWEFLLAAIDRKLEAGLCFVCEKQLKILVKIFWAY